VQDARTIRLTRDMHRAFDKVEAEYASDLRERAIFVVPHAAGLDATKPWRLQVLAVRRTADGGESAQTFEIPYTIPGDYIARTSPEAAVAGEEALWEKTWRERRYEVGALLLMLGALVLILLFQDQLAARPKLYKATRIAFMAATLGFIGLFARAQLSVVHVVTFAHALRTDFQWSFFLLDPLIFLLWGFVAVAMLFWGRGVFCGWLCPFGALQELLNEAARRLRIPQFDVPWGLHERLWIIKYLVFLAIFALSLNDMKMAFMAAEAEPFKTVVALHFAREWPFVAFALALLAAGLFVRRFYCRYLCPLALQGMRPPLPDLRQRMPGPGDPPHGRDQPERMRRLPALPGSLPVEDQVSGRHQEAEAPRDRGFRRAARPYRASQPTQIPTRRMK